MFKYRLMNYNAKISEITKQASAKNLDSKLLKT